MENLHLPHPKQIDAALPANQRCGRPEGGKVPSPAEWGPVRQSYAGLFEIDPDWVAEHLNDVHVLDVRQRDEYEGALGRIPGAQLIPISELRTRVAEVPLDKPVVTVCHSGMRSGQATVILRGGGLDRVANLRGGMLLWREMELPVEQAD
jgi:rhodanese-related sulfurtransferase